MEINKEPLTEPKKYPKAYEFEKCPNCGSTKRICNEELDILKAKGMAHKTMHCYMSHMQTGIADPSKPMLSIPVVAAAVDVCAECGTLYCFAATVSQATPQMQKPGGNIRVPGVN